MKKMLSRMIVIFAVVALAACGGGESGSSSVEDESTSSLTPMNAEYVVKALTNAAHVLSQSINGRASQTTYKTLRTLKEAGSFSVTAVDDAGSTCEFDGSGDANYDADPMSFSVSGTMICNLYTTTVGTPFGDKDIVIDATMAMSMSGVLSKDHSSAEMTFDLEWANMSLDIAGEAFEGIDGHYSLSLVAADGDVAIREEATIDGRSVLQVRTNDYWYATGVYSYYDDQWVVYIDPSLYLGNYEKDESANPDTCSNDFFGYAWADTMRVNEISGVSVTLYADSVSTVYDYDPNSPHFDGLDVLDYYYVDPGYTCIASIGSLPSVTSNSYVDHLIFGCSDGVDGCSIDYSRNNENTIRTIKSTAMGDGRIDARRKLASELQEKAKAIANAMMD